MERLRQQAGAAAAGQKAEPLFQLGLEGEALAELFTQEVAAHGMDQKPLVDLGLMRTRELGVAIAYDRDKRKFLYDGAAFEQALQDAPDGPRAVDATFKSIEGQFFRSAGKDVDEIVAASRRKEAFLRQHPKYANAVEVNLMLAIDYRDLTRLYDGLKDRRNFAVYRDRTRSQLRLVTRRHAGTEQAKVAAEMLRRFNEEMKQR